LHSKDIVHRDLKPANILYSRQDAVWKLADFGFSTEATSRSFRVTTSIRGTQGYFAPEFFGSDQPLYNNKMDIWSMGCILYEFSVGKRAFRNDFATLEYKTTGVLPAITLDEYFSEQCKKAVTESITMMLRVDANSRPTATNLIEEFSRNFEFTLTRTFDNVQIYQEFRTSSEGPRTFRELRNTAGERDEASKLEPCMRSLTIGDEGGNQSQKVSETNKIGHGRTNTSQPLKFVVKGLSGRRYPMELPLATTIDDLKSILYGKGEVPPENQRLVFKGRHMEDGRTLCDYNVRNDDLIDVVLSVRWVAGDWL